MCNHKLSSCGFHYTFICFTVKHFCLAVFSYWFPVKVVLRISLLLISRSFQFRWFRFVLLFVCNNVKYFNFWLLALICINGFVFCYSLFLILGISCFWLPVKTYWFPLGLVFCWIFLLLFSMYFVMVS